MKQKDGLIIFKQKKIGCKREFHLDDECFYYVVADESSSVKNKYSYLSLPDKDVHFEYKESNMFAFIMGICFTLVGAVQYVAMEILTGKPKFTMGTIGVIAFIFYIYNKTKYIAIPTDNVNLTVMKNGKEIEILGALYDRRNTLLKRNYAFLDQEASLEDEVNKYKYLYQVEAITKDEYDELYKNALSFHGEEQHAVH
jgi:hypothetical protein